MSSFLHHMLNSIPEESQSTPGGDSSGATLWMYFGLDMTLSLRVSGSEIVCDDNGDVGCHDGISGTDTYFGEHAVYYAWGDTQPSSWSNVWYVDNDNLDISSLTDTTITNVTCINSYRPEEGDRDQTDEVNEGSGDCYIEYGSSYINVVDNAGSSAVYLIKITFGSSSGGGGGGSDQPVGDLQVDTSLLSTPHTLTRSDESAETYSGNSITVQVPDTGIDDDYKPYPAPTSYTINFEVDQSSTLENDDGVGPAWAAMDGSSQTGGSEWHDSEEDGWEIRHHSHTNSDYNNWWQIHFTNASVVVKQIVWTTDMSLDWEYATEFTLQGSNDGVTFSDIEDFALSSRNQISTVLHGDAENGDRTYIFNFSNETPYSYYRIMDANGDESHYLLIGEIEFRFNVADHSSFTHSGHNAISASSSVTNLYFSQYSASSNLDDTDGHDPWRVFSGETLEGSEFHTKNESNPWWRLEYRGNEAFGWMSVQTIIFTWRDRSSPGGTRFKLQYSNDGSNWTDAKTFTASNVPNDQTIISLNGGVGYHRYWQILGDFTDYMNIGELEFRFYAVQWDD